MPFKNPRSRRLFRASLGIAAAIALALLGVSAVYAKVPPLTVVVGGIACAAAFGCAFNGWRAE
jgi:membrane-associated phospholipid phosphatase